MFLIRTIAIANLGVCVQQKTKQKTPELGASATHWTALGHAQSRGRILYFYDMCFVYLCARIKCNVI